MPDSFLHKRSDFKALVATVADSETILDEQKLRMDGSPVSVHFAPQWS